MHIINLNFTRFSRTPFSILFRAIGVYVIWDGRQKIRPSYIGEGNILERFAKEHTKRFSRPIDGYVAILGDISNRSYKPDARISERLLLEVGKLIDRYPTVNISEGFLKPIRDIFENHGVLKINVSGFDPFFPPWSPNQLKTKKVVRLHKERGQIYISHGWRRRS
ncbi:MAG TPA: hypothetical protein VF546_08340 [Pyrinomonadaceae bacterium]